MRQRAWDWSWRLEAAGLVLWLGAGAAGWTQEPASAGAAFDKYVGTLESRLAEERQSEDTSLGGVDRERVRTGQVLIEKLTPAKDADPPGGMLHHWRGTAFAPGATAADFERVIRDFDDYPNVYAPQVVRARLVSHDGDHDAVTMRVKQKHVITVVMDTSYDVMFGRLNERDGYSVSRSTRIDEIEAADTAKERVLTAKEKHGFLWRLNTYWNYVERDGGLYLQIESVSLTRSIPQGLGWAVRPFVESVPKESLEFTLRQTCGALKHDPEEKGAP